MKIPEANFTHLASDKQNWQIHCWAMSSGSNGTSSFCNHHSDSLSASSASIWTPVSATGHRQRRHSAERFHCDIVFVLNSYQLIV